MEKKGKGGREEKNAGRKWEGERKKKVIQKAPIVSLASFSGLPSCVDGFTNPPPRDSSRPWPRPLSPYD